MLVKATSLSFPDNDEALVLTADASDGGIGAVLEQTTPDGKQPLAYFSQQLSRLSHGMPPSTKSF